MIHLVYVLPMQVNSNTVVVPNNSVTIEQVQTTAQEPRIVLNTAVPNSINAPLIEEYLALEAAAGFILISMDNTIIVTSNESMSVGKVEKVTTITSTITLNASHEMILVNANAIPIIVNLPAASTVCGQVYQIKSIDLTNPITIIPAGVETIDAVANYSFITNLDTCVIISDSSNWWIK